MPWKKKTDPRRRTVRADGKKGNLKKGGKPVLGKPKSTQEKAKSGRGLFGFVGRKKTEKRGGNGGREGGLTDLGLTAPRGNWKGERQEKEIFPPERGCLSGKEGKRSHCPSICIKKGNYSPRKKEKKGRKTFWGGTPQIT